MLKSQKKSFALNATFLALGGLLCKIIGAVYRIPLVKILSTSGIGLYQTAFPVFAILLTLSSGGISQTISSLVSSDTDNTKSIMRAGFSVVASATLTISVLLYFLAPVLSTIQGVPFATACYRALIPAILFSGFSAVIKGYFQAKSNVAPTVISQIIEQVAKLAFGLFLANLLLPYSTLSAVVGALLGVSVSELLCFLFLFIRYISRRNKEKSTNTLYRYCFIRVLRSSIPLALGGIVLPLSSLVDSVTVVNILSSTHSLSYATAMYGIQTGVVTTITNLPAVFTLALGVTIVPVMSDRFNGTRVLKKGRISVKLALLVCIPASIFIAILAPDIIRILYPSLSQSESSVASVCLVISAIGIAPLGITQIYSSLLFSVGLTKTSVKNLVIAVVVKCIVLLPAVKFLGIYGASASTVVCYVTSSLLNAKSWHKLDDSRESTSSAGRLFVSSVVCALPIFLVKTYVSSPILFALTLICVVLYLYTVTKSRALTCEEVQSIPFLRPFTKRKERQKE